MSGRKESKKNLAVFREGENKFLAILSQTLEGCEVVVWEEVCSLAVPRRCMGDGQVNGISEIWGDWEGEMAQLLKSRFTIKIIRDSHIDRNRECTEESINIQFFKILSHDLFCDYLRCLHNNN